jgi:hypothetical protein
VRFRLSMLFVFLLQVSIGMTGAAGAQEPQAADAAGRVSITLAQKAETFTDAKGYVKGRPIPAGTTLVVTGIDHGRWISSYKGAKVYVQLSTLNVTDSDAWVKLKAMRERLVTEYLQAHRARREAETEKVSAVKAMESRPIEGPKGVRLFWPKTYFGGLEAEGVPDKGLSPSGEDRAYLYWGSTEDLMTWQLGGKFGCLQDACQVYDWLMDFGDPETELQPTLFLHEGAFYRYLVTFAVADFDFIEGTLAKALGTPATSDDGTVQNRMGAEFDQKTRIWKTKDVEVVLKKRASKVDEGALMVSYLPIAVKADAKKDEGQAPF